MKSKIWKGLKVTSELKPVIGIKDSRFIYTRESNLAEKFAAIRERMAAEKMAEAPNVTVMQKRKVK